MVISADIPEQLITKIDALILPELTPPVWPFENRTIVVKMLHPADIKKWEDYQAAYTAYETRQRDAAVPRNRSAALRKILAEYFASKETLTEDLSSTL